jgi:hypothetical protein
MSVTLKPVLDALGYTTATQQRAVVKLMQASGAFGEVPGVDGVLTDLQADAILNNVTFTDLAHAAEALHVNTQQHMIRRPPGAERHDCEESEHFIQNREALMEAMRQAGMIDKVKVTQKYYDHVLILGSTEAEVDKRLDHLKQLWDQGVRFGRIELLGSERALTSGMEASAGIMGENGSPSRIEMDMMENRYYAKSADWPRDMQNVRVFEVNTYNKPGGERANTKDTIVAWEKTHPAAGDVLVMSSQPYVRYQDAAVKAALPRSFHVETVGEAAPRDLKVSVGMDTLARQIDVGFDKLKERLKTRRPKLDAQLVLIDPAAIKVDAATYQFRARGDANGVTEKGRYHADRWDPVMHGDPILVHERLDGSVFVADGHHRVDLAKKLNEKGAGPGKMAAMVLREADGYTAKDVKIIAAYKNIAHGNTDPVEVARVFKEAHSGDVNLDLLPHLQMDKGNLKMSFTLSKLSDKALDSVARGEITPEMAANVAERVPDDPARQERVITLIHKKLHQKYHVVENAQPTQVQINIFNLPKEVATMPGFVEKLASQRGRPTEAGLVC